MTQILSLDKYDYYCPHYFSFYKRICDWLSKYDDTHSEGGDNEQRIEEYDDFDFNYMLGHGFVSMEAVFGIKNEKNERKKTLLFWDLRRVFIGPFRNRIFDYIIDFSGFYTGLCFIVDEETRGTSHELYEHLVSVNKHRENDIVICYINSTCIYMGSRRTLDTVQSLAQGVTLEDQIDNDINYYLFRYWDNLCNGINCNDPDQYIKADLSDLWRKVQGEAYWLAVYRVALLLKHEVELKNPFDPSEIHINPFKGFTIQALEKYTILPFNKSEPFDAFVCRSPYGAILAAGLSVLFKKPIVFLHSFDDEENMKYIQQYKKTVFIYDYINTFDEYRKACKTIDVCSSQYACGIGLNCNFNENVSFWVDEWNDTHKDIEFLSLYKQVKGEREMFDINPHFKIGITFSGRYRKEYVEPFANALLKLGYDKKDIFYDAWHEALINGVSGDVILQDIYSNRCDCIVVLLSPDYKGKVWTGHVEWPAVRGLINSGQGGKICLLSVDSVNIKEIPGLFIGEAIPKAIDTLSSKEIARFIDEKYQIIRNKTSNKE